MPEAVPTIDEDATDADMLSPARIPDVVPSQLEAQVPAAASTSAFSFLNFFNQVSSNLPSAGIAVSGPLAGRHKACAPNHTCTHNLRSCVALRWQTVEEDREQHHLDAVNFNAPTPKTSYKIGDRVSVRERGGPARLGTVRAYRREGRLVWKIFYSFFRCHKTGGLARTSHA